MQHGKPESQRTEALHSKHSSHKHKSYLYRSTNWAHFSHFIYHCFPLSFNNSSFHCHTKYISVSRINRFKLRSPWCACVLLFSCHAVFCLFKPDRFPANYLLSVIFICDVYDYIKATFSLALLIIIPDEAT